MQSKTPLLQKLKIRSRCVTGVRTSSGHKLSWTFFLIFISLNVDLDRRIQNSQLLLYKDAPCNLIGISPFLDLVDKKGPRTKQWLWCTFAISNDWGTRKWRENDQDYKIKCLLHILLILCIDYLYRNYPRGIYRVYMERLSRVWKVFQLHILDRIWSTICQIKAEDSTNRSEE